ncbi:hypothetical protein AB2S23_28135, partial [Klebsiella pneumoniae]
MNRTLRRCCLYGLISLSLFAPVPAVYAASIETGYSPEGTALQLVLKTIRGQFGYRKLLYYKDFPGMSKPVFMVSVCSSVKIKGRDCGTIN